jgi:3-oxoacyl-[acyl-carrier protein] reductase
MVDRVRRRPPRGAGAGLLSKGSFGSPFFVYGDRELDLKRRRAHDNNNPMDLHFSGKAVLVTGGSRGIGRAISRAFASAGARVCVNYRSDEAAARECLAGLSRSGHALVKADVASPEGAGRAVEGAVEALGRLDVVVNNAGIVGNHPIADTDYEEWRHEWQRILATNLLGAANVCYCAARFMMGHGGGRIVNVSSRGAFRGEPAMPAYAASKAGLNAMSQSLAVALAPYNIFVGVVAPGFVETEMSAARLAGPRGDAIRNQSPLGRVARPEEVANVVLFLAAEGSEFTTGTIIDVNGASYLRM